MNKVIQKGRTTKKPQVSYDGDSCVARFTLAVEDRSYKLEDGKCHVDYIPCFTIGKLAELIDIHVSKGQELLLVGKWRSSFYEKGGKTIYTQGFFIQELFFCGKKTDNPQQEQEIFMNIPDDLDDELPFK